MQLSLRLDFSSADCQVSLGRLVALLELLDNLHDTENPKIDKKIQDILKISSPYREKNTIEKPEETSENLEMIKISWIFVNPWILWDVSARCNT